MAYAPERGSLSGLSSSHRSESVQDGWEELSTNDGSVFVSGERSNQAASETKPTFIPPSFFDADESVATPAYASTDPHRQPWSAANPSHTRSATATSNAPRATRDHQATFTLSESTATDEACESCSCSSDGAAIASSTGHRDRHLSSSHQPRNATPFFAVDGCKCVCHTRKQDQQSPLQLPPNSWLRQYCSHLSAPTPLLLFHCLDSRRYWPSTSHPASDFNPNVPRHHPSKRQSQRPYSQSLQHRRQPHRHPPSAKAKATAPATAPLHRRHSSTFQDHHQHKSRSQGTWSLPTSPAASRSHSRRASRQPSPSPSSRTFHATPAAVASAPDVAFLATSVPPLSRQPIQTLDTSLGHFSIATKISYECQALIWESKRVTVPQHIHTDGVAVPNLDYAEQLRDHWVDESAFPNLHHDEAKHQRLKGLESCFLSFPDFVEPLITLSTCVAPSTHQLSHKQGNQAGDRATKPDPSAYRQAEQLLSPEVVTSMLEQDQPWSLFLQAITAALTAVQRNLQPIPILAPTYSTPKPNTSTSSSRVTASVALLQSSIDTRPPFVDPHQHHLSSYSPRTMSPTTRSRTGSMTSTGMPTSSSSSATASRQRTPSFSRPTAASSPAAAVSEPTQSIRQRNPHTLSAMLTDHVVTNMTTTDTKQRSSADASIEPRFALKCYQLLVQSLAYMRDCNSAPASHLQPGHRTNTGQRGTRQESGGQQQQDKVEAGIATVLARAAQSLGIDSLHVQITRLHSLCEGLYFNRSLYLLVIDALTQLNQSLCLLQTTQQDAPHQGSRHGSRGGVEAEKGASNVQGALSSQRAQEKGLGDVDRESIVSACTLIENHLSHCAHSLHLLAPISDRNFASSTKTFFKLVKAYSQFSTDTRFRGATFTSLNMASLGRTLLSNTFTQRVLALVSSAQLIHPPSATSKGSKVSKPSKSPPTFPPTQRTMCIDAMLFLIYYACRDLQLVRTVYECTQSLFWPSTGATSAHVSAYDQPNFFRMACKLYRAHISPLYSQFCTGHLARDQGQRVSARLMQLLQLFRDFAALTAECKVHQVRGSRDHAQPQDCLNLSTTLTTTGSSTTLGADGDIDGDVSCHYTPHSASRLQPCISDASTACLTPTSLPLRWLTQLQDKVKTYALHSLQQEQFHALQLAASPSQHLAQVSRAASLPSCPVSGSMLVSSPRQPCASARSRSVSGFPFHAVELKAHKGESGPASEVGGRVKGVREVKDGEDALWMHGKHDGVLQEESECEGTREGRDNAGEQLGLDALHGEHNEFSEPAILDIIPSAYVALKAVEELTWFGLEIMQSLRLSASPHFHSRIQAIARELPLEQLDASLASSNHKDISRPTAHDVAAEVDGPLRDVLDHLFYTTHSLMRDYVLALIATDLADIPKSYEQVLDQRFIARLQSANGSSGTQPSGSHVGSSQAGVEQGDDCLLSQPVRPTSQPQSPSTPTDTRTHASLHSHPFGNAKHQVLGGSCDHACTGSQSRCEVAALIIDQDEAWEFDEFQLLDTSWDQALAGRTMTSREQSDKDGLSTLHHAADGNSSFDASFLSSDTAILPTEPSQPVDFPLSEQCMTNDSPFMLELPDRDHSHIQRLQSSRVSFEHMNQPSQALIKALGDAGIAVPLKHLENPILTQKMCNRNNALYAFSRMQQRLHHYLQYQASSSSSHSDLRKRSDSFFAATARYHTDVLVTRGVHTLKRVLQAFFNTQNEQASAQTTSILSPVFAIVKQHLISSKRYLTPKGYIIFRRSMWHECIHQVVAAWQLGDTQSAFRPVILRETLNMASSIFKECGMPDDIVRQGTLTKLSLASMMQLSAAKLICLIHQASWHALRGDVPAGSSSSVGSQATPSVVPVSLGQVSYDRDSQSPDVPSPVLAILAPLLGGRESDQASVFTGVLCSLSILQLLRRQEQHLRPVYDVHIQSSQLLLFEVLRLVLMEQGLIKDHGFFSVEPATITVKDLVEAIVDHGNFAQLSRTHFQRFDTVLKFDARFGTTFGMELDANLQVVSVHDRSPAFHAGVLVGDCLKRFENEPVDAHSLHQLHQHTRDAKFHFLRSLIPKSIVSRTVALELVQDFVDMGELKMLTSLPSKLKDNSDLLRFQVDQWSLQHQRGDFEHQKSCDLMHSIQLQLQLFSAQGVGYDRLQLQAVEVLRQMHPKNILARAFAAWWSNDRRCGKCLRLMQRCGCGVAADPRPVSTPCS
eukprot:m.292051 g.292051  ORF g.292051 m.292051 type:complete len:2197 (-) comp15833_c0_seq2:63-6653(-)